jgi:hypothetical protein
LSKKIAIEAAESRPVWETPEAFVGVRIQELLQVLLVQKVEEMIREVGATSTAA